ncbi:DUF3980 domain-containing protein [Bacillus pseudomycoides]|uniref:DUF3980 domain-containing protein n=1 Tax=Bacillus pseudomycoides TaxID=64104 RepID=UPI000BEB8AC5|nr:DUF3980 domain-containing protein [Bacillus pseudomycoides]PDY47256.1 hypothetical protein CON79_10735 [Bacillus pseudomycoides]PED05520.1 hypothetical protein COO19_25995 [Bacillus pseudomycoides]PED71519.1 hypothetical protein CON97_13550 [Bacillus pseudomycoides]PEI47191.1 hypothetical protein CN620_00145 [Bacillus pseudomycoides]PEI96922.1 hypothetical protein CN686_11350 [Bacillus pseudomycoides]
MFNRKCSRCKEITGTVHGGKKIQNEFLCEDCLQKGVGNGEFEIPKEEPSYLSVKILKVMSVIYLVVSIFSSVYTVSLISGLSHGFQTSISVEGSGAAGFIVLGAIFQSILIFCVIWMHLYYFGYACSISLIIV